MTRDEALRAAENCLNYVTTVRLPSHDHEAGKAIALMAQAKAEAAKAYIELAKLLSY